ncbi:hypothetical protein ACDY96_19515 [Rhizobium mongolense]|uniref:hypothetical protein n=1 Tax=Rhizobium mongolense TaxID=57676 RepID=UPI0035590BB2
MDAASSDSSALLPGESLVTAAGYPVLTYFRKGETDKPLAVFLPGGGHLARVAYGHPTLRPDDFLDHWLQKQGFGLLAISYPSDHPVYDRTFPAMTLVDWGRVAADVTRRMMDDHGLQKNVILLGWSMAGRAVRPYNTAATALGIDVEAFLSLAATPPLFLNTDVEEAFWLTEAGLRETRHPKPGLENHDRFRWWDIALAEQAQLNGRPVFDGHRYFEIFRGNHPANLNGERLRYRDGILVSDIAEAIEDMGSFEYGDYPLTACLIPETEHDLRHAVTDAPTWGFINSQKILRTWLQPLMARDPGRMRERWEEIGALVHADPQRLNAFIPGGHLFFTGALGAERTAAQIQPLLHEIRRQRALLDAVVVSRL